MVETIGIWVAALLTICIFSFLFKDNFLYKFSEHLFIGVSAGYWCCRYFWSNLVPKLWDPLLFGKNVDSVGERLLYLIPLGLGIMMLCKIIPSLSWTSRWPIAFIVGATLGLAIIGKSQTNIIAQVRATVKPFHAMPAWMFQEMDNMGHKDGYVSRTEMEEFKTKFVAKLPPDRDGDKWISLKETAAFNGVSEELFSVLDNPQYISETKQVEKAAKLIYDKLGPGFAEEVYARALAREIQAKPMETIPIKYGKEMIGQFVVDVLFDRVLIDISIKDKIEEADLKTLENYVIKSEKATVGLLLLLGDKITSAVVRKDAVKRGYITSDEVTSFASYLAHAAKHGGDQGKLTREHLENYVALPDLSFKKIDNNSNGYLTLAELKNYAKAQGEKFKIDPEKAFQAWDYDQSNRISLWETEFAAEIVKYFDELLVVSGGKEIDTQKFTKDFVSYMALEKMDANEDKKISKDEALTYGGMPELIFNRMDQDKNGFIAPQWEHREFKEQLPESLDTYFTVHDKDGDGKITDTERRTGHLVYWKSFRTRTIVDALLIFVAVVTSLIYFFFSKEHTGAFGVASRVGIYFLMITFGAAFGYTVMARISLLIDRILFLMKDWIGVI